MNTVVRSTLLACTAAGGLVVALAAPAFAMTIKNTDAEMRSIKVTDVGGESNMQDVQPNETVTLCESGCFITFPNGSLTAYEGTENIIIKDGAPALPN